MKRKLNLMYYNHQQCVIRNGENSVELRLIESMAKLNQRRTTIYDWITKKKKKCFYCFSRRVEFEHSAVVDKLIDGERLKRATVNESSCYFGVRGHAGVRSSSLSFSSFLLLLSNTDRWFYKANKHPSVHISSIEK